MTKKMNTLMCVSEWIVRSLEVNTETGRYISIYPYERERENRLVQKQIDRKTKREVDNSRKERESCVNDGVNVFVNDISRRVTFGAFSGERMIKAHSLQ